MAKRTQEFYNWGKTYKAFSQAILGAGKALNSIALVELQEVAVKYLRSQDAKWPHTTTAKSKGGRTMKFGGDINHPWYTGQLHDSVAVRIMQGNRITSVHYMPPSPDTGKPQHTENIKNIIGVEWAREIAEQGGPRYLLPGVQVQLIVGVPYSDKVNESGRHQGFASNLADELTADVDKWIADGGLRRPTVIATDKGAKVINKTNITYKKSKK